MISELQVQLPPEVPVAETKLMLAIKLLQRL